MPYEIGISADRRNRLYTRILVLVISSWTTNYCQNLPFEKM